MSVRSDSFLRVKPPAIRHLLAVLAVALLAGCAAPRNTVTQIRAIDALLAGAYDGQTPSGELTRKGDLGLGTFDKLDGEMVVLDGHIYQVRADGKVYSPAPSVTTPFAAVVKFRPTGSAALKEGTPF